MKRKYFNGDSDGQDYAHLVVAPQDDTGFFLSVENPSDDSSSRPVFLTPLQAQSLADLLTDRDTNHLWEDEDD